MPRASTPWSAIGLVEGDALQGAAAHPVPCTFGKADQAHALVECGRAEAALGDLGSRRLFAEQDVGREPSRP